MFVENLLYIIMHAVSHIKPEVIKDFEMLKKFYITIYFFFVPFVPSWHIDNSHRNMEARRKSNVCPGL